MKLDGFEQIIVALAREVSYYLRKIGASYEAAEDMRLNGIVLTGRSENFKQLIGQPWIKAASAGASAEIVPYIQPTK